MIRSRPFGNAAGSAARVAPSRRSEQLALVLLEIELSQEHIKNETPKKARGDRRQEWRFHCEISHTETSSYLRNLAVPRGFERPSYVTRWRRTGWLRRGFECASRFTGRNLKKSMEFPPISINRGISRLGLRGVDFGCRGCKSSRPHLHHVTYCSKLWTLADLALREIANSSGRYKTSRVLKFPASSKSAD